MADELLKLRALLLSHKIPVTSSDPYDVINLHRRLNYWVTNASNNDDRRLREKMAEWTLQSKVEDGYVDKEAANDGIAKQTDKSPESAEEVQILIQQWKTIADMTAGLRKDISDMAMTPMRDLR